MAPKPDDDLFIEPADDEDVVYGDYNNTMDGTSSSGPRPYIRLTSQLRNATRDAGGEVRFRCEAVGTPPLSFAWYKNYAPVEKSRRVKIRTKENSSRLVINELDVLDSGFYQCIASNSAASVNTTSILRVNNVPDVALKNRKSKTHSIEDYEDYELMDRGRLPDEEDADLYRVPDTAAGHGYIPSGVNERWLDGIKYRAGDCVPYRGEACRHYLAGRHIMLTSENREEMYDIDRNLRAAMLFINNSPTVSQQCRQISHSVACFHMYKVCDGIASGSRQPLAICKSDCDRIQKDVCPEELTLAAQHELVGDGAKALFPSCPTLPQSSNCIPVLQSHLSTSSEPPKPHWCYTNTGTTYEGAISTTVSGKACMSWEDSTSRDFNVRRYPELLRAKNHCRNPGGKKTKPWCYSQPMGQEEYCDVQPCPKELYNSINETPRGNNGISATDSVTNWWESLSSQWQYGMMIGGVSFFILLIFLICCCCCCRAKKKKGKTRSSAKNMSVPPSIVNSTANSAYYRKLNGNSTPIVGRGGPAGPMEMAHLLPNQMGMPPPFSEYRQQEIEETYTVRSIPPNQLKKEQLVGEGQFGMIHRGSWAGALLSGEPLQVAIKSVRIDPSNADRANLEEEVRTVAAFDHPHVTKLLGIVYWNQSQMSAVFEFMIHGDLYEFLRIRNPGSHTDNIMNNTDDFMSIATQIAYGMEYLASMNYVHRDLATRNCLVWDNHMIKIATFPLMKDSHHSDYYKMPHRTWVPVRWMSKESLEQGRFTEASDVWAFGVTLWEIWSYGRQPYEGHTNQQVIEFVANRNLLECPPNCPSKIYSLMVECWHENPDRRPNFNELHNRLQTWSVASPAHSILNPARNSNSSQSGSSMSGRGPQKPLGVSQSRQPYNPRGVRRLEGASPLMRREGNYTYSEDDVESD